MSGYPRGVLFEYDPTKQWTQGIHNFSVGTTPITYTDQSLNPRWCGKLAEHGSGAHKMYASAKGADGNLYFGGQWMRDGNGGGLAWYNPNTQEMGGLSEPFLNYAIQHLCAVNNGRYIAISTVCVTSADGYKPNSAKIFIFDTKSKKIINTLDPMADLNGKVSGQIIGVDKDHIVGLTSDPDTYLNTYIYRINIISGKLDFRFKVLRKGFEANFAIGNTIAFNDDGDVVTWLGGYVVKIDPLTGDIEVQSQYNYDSRKGVAGDMVLDGNDIYIGRFNTLLKL